MAKSNLLDKVAGDKGAAVKDLLGSGNKADALKNLFDKKKPAETATDTSAATVTPPTEAPKSAEDQAKEKAANKLKKLLNF
jgi:AsmA protein